jgi:hypothetical protein
MFACKWLGVLAVGGLTVWAPTRAAAAGRQVPEARQTPDAVQRHRAFTPPADAKLTSDQVRMYIAVRRRAATLPRPNDDPAEPAAQIQRLLAGLTSESQAASEIGADLDEYRWVSARVAESSSSVATPGDALVTAIAAAANGGRQALRSTGEAGQQTIASETSTAALAYNRQLLNRFRTELTALNAR